MCVCIQALQQSPLPMHPTSQSMHPLVQKRSTVALSLLFLATACLQQLAHLCIDALPVTSSPAASAPLASQWRISSQENNLTVLANANFSLILTRSPPPNSPLCTLIVQHIPSGLHTWVANFHNLSTMARSVGAPQNCTLNLQKDGDLQLMESTQLSYHSGTESRGVSTIQLLDTGNLVLANNTHANASLDIVWQSFEHPSDTLITGQKLGVDVTLYAAASDNAYTSGGMYSMALSLYLSDLILYASFNETPGAPQEYWSLQATFATPANAWVCCWASYVQVDNGLTIYDNQSQAGMSTPSSNLNPDKDLFEYARLEPDGNLRTYVFKGGAWQPNFQALTKTCQHPNACGPYGICNSASDVCSTCLPGFHPVNSSDPSQGCTSSQLLSSDDQCKTNASSVVTLNATGYMYFFAQSFYMSGHADNYTNTLGECEESCLRNCSCQSAFYSQSTGCYLMEYPIRTIQQSDDKSQVMFLKLANVSSLVAPASSPHPGVSPSPQPQIPIVDQSSRRSRIRTIAIGFSSAAAVATMGLIVWFLRKRKLRAREQEEDEMFLHTLPGLPLRFSYKNLQKATDGFSRKIGAGGFGSVYEGVFLHQETRVAVKELKNTQQSGIKQFRAEIATLGKISHTNLVRLCGYCIEGSHRLLVYEFMANTSLDRALFDDDAGVEVLDWKMRHAIALGTARGLAYLHEECTSRIIHCDVKPENILLDKDWVPKVSDFGLAKLTCRDQSYMVSTLRGTRGYLAPEWIRNAPITEKSDVFSFGIVLLELVAGRRSFDLRIQQPEQCYLPAWAFDLVGESAELLVLAHEKLRKNNLAEKHEIERVIKIALWCIQEEATLRPAMSLVVKMLEGDADVLSPPVCLFFDKARPHHLQFEPSSGSRRLTSGSASEESRAVQSQISWQMSTLVSGR